MSKLKLPGRIWIASDIHLGPHSPSTAAAFHDFLKAAANQADALLLAGDIFDAWIGDDVIHRPEPWLKASLQVLRQTAACIPLWLGRGNRDFLIGDTLLRHLGARALPEPALLETDAGAVLLAHGDEYCTADAGYLRFRRIVRNPLVQRSYLALPLRTRQAIASWARQRSMQSNQYKSADIMDVESGAIIDALRAANTPWLIHGHTHRPARHTHTVDGQQRERVVLPDWDFDHTDTPRGGWVVIDSKGVHLIVHGPHGFLSAS